MALDYSQLFAPVPESGVNRGARMFTDVLDAIMARRQQKELADQQLKAQQAQQAASMQFDREKLAQDARFKQQDDSRAEQIRQDQAAQMQAQRDQHMSKARGEAIEKAFGMAREGNAANVPAYLRSIDPNASIAPKRMGPADTTNTPDDAITAMDEIQGSVQDRQAFNDQNRDVYEMNIGGQTTDLNLQPLTPEARAKMIAAMAGPDSPLTAAAKRAGTYAAAGAIKPGTESKVLEDELERNAANERARIGARAAGARQGTTMDDKRADNARADFTDYLKQNNFQDVNKEMAAFDKILNAGKNGNKSGIASQMFMGLYTKYAQGQVGVLNQNDIDTFWNKAGSPDERTEEALTKILSGKNGEAKRVAALNALQVLRDTVAAEKERIYRDAVPLMESFGDDGDRRLRAIFGKGLPGHEKKRAAEKAKGDASLDAQLKAEGF